MLAADSGMRKVYSLLFQPQPRPPAIAWSSMISYDGDEMQVMADFNRDEINAVHVSNALSRSLSALTATHGDTMVDLQRVYPKPISQFSEPYYRGSRTRASLLPKLRQRRRARLSRICCSGNQFGAPFFRRSAVQPCPDHCIKRGLDVTFLSDI